MTEQHFHCLNEFFATGVESSIFDFLYDGNVSRVDAILLPMKFARSPLVGAIHQGRDQHDEHSGIDLPSQEAHRYRGVPEATSFGRAAEAITPVPLLREFVRDSTCFARIIRSVELAAAGSAAALGGFLGLPAVDLKKKLEESRVL